MITLWDRLRWCKTLVFMTLQKLLIIACVGFYFFAVHDLLRAILLGKELAYILRIPLK